MAWNPESTVVAFIVADPIDEGVRHAGVGYFIRVFDGDDVTSVNIP